MSRRIISHPKNSISIDSRPQYLRVADKIKQKIFSGSIKIGDKLPTERELAQRYNVGRPSIREAIRSLENLGLVETLQGSGTYVRNNTEKIILNSFDIIYNTNDISNEEVVQFREMFEYAAVKLAATNATDAEIRKLEKILEKMKIVNTSKELERVDLLFHEQIANMTHNTLILQIFKAMRSFFDNCIKSTNDLIYSKGENNEDIISYHIPITDAIKDRDPSVALVFMERHFKKIRELMQK
ncbi:hypothetical protein HMPREF9628_00576 [Peptoanaerobacter stomatis]|uniref:HTH gntR-type domain-containing protein n=1 Tax=Peptoanaerobacter stomatis TaxID=796937 RepID=G9XF74_9FIRM|nr:FadR/GntR family transcriptional regulator [Peptoanaerobacter stomatis]EHL17466.1 hypothetical protein HMPREF9628_00576 [Peptoanaerobacter stomatis]